MFSKVLFGKRNQGRYAAPTESDADAQGNKNPTYILFLIVLDIVAVRKDKRNKVLLLLTPG